MQCNSIYVVVIITTILLHVCRSISTIVDELSTCLSEWRSRGFDVHTCVADVSTEEGRGLLVHEAET